VATPEPSAAKPGRNGKKMETYAVVYYEHEYGREEIGRVLTNRNMTTDEALDMTGVDMDKWAMEQGWEGWDYNCIVVDYETELKVARLDAKLTQRAMSDEFGIPKRTIENWESGKRTPPPYVERLILEKLAQMKRSE
jgi:DNA-binding XRE family transcriptional regulator